jgi:hypothetical protein
VRRFLGFMLLSALSLPALAAGSPKAKAPHQHHARMTWGAHFAQANRAHDGHLTLAEAKGGDTMVAKHFDEIDVTHRGYVTEDDIRIWREKHKVTRGGKKTRTATQPGTAQLAPVATAATQTGATPAVHPAAPGNGSAKD